MMAQATFVSMAIGAGRLQATDQTHLPDLEEIGKYPSTELSQAVGSVVRATVNALAGIGPNSIAQSSWSKDFWNRGLALENCEF